MKEMLGTAFGSQGGYMQDTFVHSMLNFHTVRVNMVDM